MWEIYANDKAVVSSRSDPPSEVDGQLSFFRGPNKIVVYCRTPTKALNLQGSDKMDYEFKATDGFGNTNCTIHCKLADIHFDPKTQSQKITLIPDIHNYDRKIVRVLEPESKIGKSVGDIAKILFNPTSNSDVRVQCSDTDKSFSNFSFTGRPLDFVANYCQNNLLEFYASDNKLTIGDYIYVEPPKNETLFDVSYPIIEQENTTTAFWHRGTKITTVYADLTLPMPGELINVQNKIVRVFHVKYFGHKDGSFDSVAYCTDIGEPITEIEMASLLDDDTLYNRIKNRQYVSVGLGTKEKDGRKKVQLGFKSRNPDNLGLKNTDEGYSTSVKLSTPYAADKAGIQFPKNENSITIMGQFQGEDACAWEIGQAYDKSMNEPAKDEDAFSLTHPSGARIYIDEEGNIVIAGKSIKIGGMTAGAWNKKGDAIVDSPSSKKAARTGDDVISNTISDSQYWLWSELFKSMIQSWVPTPTDGGTVLKSLLAAVIGQWPDEQYSTIDKGSGDVYIGGRES